MKNFIEWFKSKWHLKVFVYFFLVLALSLIIKQSFGLTNTAANAVTILQVIEQPIIINGKKSYVFNIVQPNGTVGYIGSKNTLFNAIVENKTTVPITIHWHGLIVPNNQDGVPYVTQLPIPPGGSYHYHFMLKQAGTFWMHSHYQLQEQELLAAPFIIKDPHDPYKNAQDVVMMLQDFTFKNPEQLFLSLRKKLPMANMATDNSFNITPANINPKTMKALTGQLPASMKGMSMSNSNSADLNDVDYDALLTNRHTLQNPQIISVMPGETVRLRVINGASASEFWLNTGTLMGTAIAIDGSPIKPYQNKQFQLAIGQRLDILLTIPQHGGAFPILAQSQGTGMQTGLILKTSTATAPIISTLAVNKAPPLNYDQELQLKALQPLVAKPIDKTLIYTLEGDMKNYIWTINGQTWPKVIPLTIKQDQRIAMVFINNTGMAHPMHLHGHIFELINIDGKNISDGALHDTIYILPHSTLTVIFDANNPGLWMLHCHILYHQAGGMMSTINYDHYPESKMYKNLLAGSISDG